MSRILLCSANSVCVVNTGVKKEIGKGKCEVVEGGPDAAPLQSKRKRKASKKQQEIENDRSEHNQARGYLLLWSQWKHSKSKHPSMYLGNQSCSVQLHVVLGDVLIQGLGSRVLIFNKVTVQSSSADVY